MLYCLQLCIELSFILLCKLFQHTSGHLQQEFSRFEEMLQVWGCASHSACMCVCICVYTYIRRDLSYCGQAHTKIHMQALNKDLYTKITLTETHACIRAVNGAYVHIAWALNTYYCSWFSSTVFCLNIYHPFCTKNLSLKPLELDEEDCQRWQTFTFLAEALERRWIIRTLL